MKRQINRGDGRCSTDVIIHETPEDRQENDMKIGKTWLLSLMCRSCRCQYKVVAVRTVCSFRHDLLDFSLAVMPNKSAQRHE